jgi:hypothetical protein
VGVCERVPGVSLHETALSADLGGSSNYSSAKCELEGRRWRRVSYQQQLDMSESFLSHGGNLCLC